MKAKKVKVVSPRFSLKGWNVKAFVKGNDIRTWMSSNWKMIKELTKVIAPAILGWLATANPEWTAVITILGKAALDIGDYFFGVQTQ